MKECKILGYRPYDEKNELKQLTGKKMLRIIITIESEENSESYGRIPVPVYLDYNEEFEKDLKLAIDDDLVVKYTTEENILTGKTRVKNILFNY